MGFNARQSAPPGPPAPFDPGRIPQGYEEAQRQQLELEQDHARMRPHEPPTVMGPITQFAPPANPRGLAFEAPKPPVNYPCWRYHRTLAPDGVLLRDERDEKALCVSDGWQNKPFAKIEGVTTAKRLELLDKILIVLGHLAEGQETPMEALLRTIDEHDKFAHELAKKGTKSNGSAR